jgi:MFS family permease
MTNPPLKPALRWLMLVAVFLGLFFDGLELGLMPVASQAVTKSMMGEKFTATAGGDWFARYTASLMLGAAIGGILLGLLGDMIGRSRAMGISILFYSIFAACGAWVTSQEQMLYLRFLVGLGVGGMWPNGIALVSECWPNTSKATVAGVMSAGLNFGILALSQIAREFPITPDSWRWLFYFAGLPAILGVIVIAFVPESPLWKEQRLVIAMRFPISQLFSPSLIRFTLLAIAVSCIPLIGAWSASKWMIPWADKVAGPDLASYKATTQGWWALGATIGSFIGAQVAASLGQRWSYFLISLGSTALTITMFQASAPLHWSFHPIVFCQGLVATLFFGWLAHYLPQFFPVGVRATGTGLAYNVGRFATAFGVLLAGGLFTLLGGNYPQVGAICACIYAIGIPLAFWLPKRT